MISILVLEDDESLGYGLQYAFEKENWNVRLTKSISEAEEFLQKQTPSLILLDNHLPDGLGIDFCKRIRQSSNVPIIFLTAADEEIDIVRGLDMGADDYITKPFRVMELTSRVKSALRRAVMIGHSSSLRHEIKSKDIALFIEMQRAEKNGVDLRLTTTEYKLLVTFIKNANQILSREQLLQKLWDIDGNFIDDNTLSVNIRRLREKIEECPSNPKYIRTIRGKGYIWEQGSVSS
ncbi:response regulator transcription factor [Priestia megaterium]|nr:response regulator transcription factor [Priestia megaterium]